jgi:sporulation protein YlmC with PRC-barrel domain
MTKSLLGGLAGVVLVISGANFIVAQDGAKPAAEGQQYRAKQILGARVNLEGNNSVGTVDDIVLDENGNVDYLIVANQDDKLVTVPWDAARFNVEKRIAVVNIPQQKFRQAPTYTVDQYPVFSAPAYRTQVYRYYGLTPHEQRRAIRRGAVVVP